jgi:hypothetical protein
MEIQVTSNSPNAGVQNDPCRVVPLIMLLAGRDSMGLLQDKSFPRDIKLKRVF